MVGQEFRLVKVSFSYEAYVDPRYLSPLAQSEFKEKIEDKTQELLPQIDPDYTTGKTALRVDKVVMEK